MCFGSGAPVTSCILHPRHTAGLSRFSGLLSAPQTFNDFVQIATGQREIYIRGYSEPGGQVTVSVGGGRESVWANNGDLFYRSLTGERMFAVLVTTEPALKVQKPVELFQGSTTFPHSAPPVHNTMSRLTGSGFSSWRPFQARTRLRLV